MSLHTVRTNMQSPPIRLLVAGVMVLLAAVGFSFIAVANSGARVRGAASASVHVKSISGVGAVLVNSAGKTLYAFSKDHRSHVSCSGTCATYWPALYTSGKPIAGSGVKASMLGTIKAPNGKEQVTYNHWPLYTYVADTKAGQDKGEGLSTFGGTWHALHSNGTIATKSSSGGGGGGGYGY